MNTTVLEGGRVKSRSTITLNFSSIVFAPPVTRNVLCAKNDGLCQAWLSVGATERDCHC